MNTSDLIEQQAVEAAINLRWEDAIKLNEEIIKIDRQNLAAYLRIGFAYLQLNDIKMAKRSYHKALKIQAKNSIALDNIERIKVLEERGVKKTKLKQVLVSPNLFIESPGKTKTVSLVNYGQKNVLAKLLVGQELNLRIKKRKLEVRTIDGEYIGALPDDLSRRLTLFIKAKSLYKVYIKEASLNRVVIFLKEELKGKPMLNHISFPVNIQKNLASLSNPEEDKTESIDDLEEEVAGWDKLVEEAGEIEKEEIVGVHTEEDDNEEE